MGIFDRKHRAAAGKEPSLAESMAAQQAAHAAEQDDFEERDLPSVNRRKGGNKLVTIIGFGVILALAAASIIAVNKKERSRTAGKPAREERVANNLPPIVMPAMAAESDASAQPPAPPRPVVVPTLERMAEPPVPPRLVASPKSTKGSAEPDWADRKMGAMLLVGANGGGSARSRTAPYAAAPMPAGDTMVRPSGGLLGEGEGSAGGGLAAQLEPTVTKGVSAALLPNRNYLITKGTSLDCAMETAIDSSLPGITTCRLTRDVYSDNGRVLLLERGSQLVGEYQGGIKQGQVRVFVLWTRAKTPNGVVVALNSPGTDALGRAGLDGWVDNHFIERFGAAILMSIISDTVRGIANRSDSETTNYYGSAASSGEKIIEKILESTVNIPPTIVKNQGEHVQVMVARDLDFSSVYALRVKP